MSYTGDLFIWCGEGKGKGKKQGRGRWPWFRGGRKSRDRGRGGGVGREKKKENERKHGVGIGNTEPWRLIDVVIGRARDMGQEGLVDRTVRYSVMKYSGLTEKTI